jgi:futalosine hydrolase
VGDLAVAASDTYADLGVISPGGWQSAEAFAEPLAVVDGVGLHNTFPLDPGLVEASARIFRAGPWTGRAPTVGIGPFLTTSQVTGASAYAALLEARWAGIAESMEGAAAAHICALYGVPFLEVRGVSNLVVDRDRGSWKVEEAARLAAEAALMICGRLDEVLVACRAAGVDEGADGGAADKGFTWTP